MFKPAFLVEADARKSFVDIHAGAASEDLDPYFAYYKFGPHSMKAEQIGGASVSGLS